MTNTHTIIKNKIIFFYFCLTRKHNEKDLHDLSILLDDLLYILKLSLYECDENVEIDIYISYFILLYKLVAYTRDICLGKGERDLTYIMVEIWYKYFPVLAKHMLQTIAEVYGSWKDLKYYCKYTKHEKMMDYSIELWNNQLEKDLLSFSTEKISNVSKWIPREKSTFGWLFEKCAIDWYPRFYGTIPLNTNIIKKEYRQILSSVNCILDTTQIKETQKKWNEIIPENTSITTKSKQYYTFINTNNYLLKERIQCKHNFEKYFSQNKPEKEKRMKSFHLGEYIKHPHLQNQKYWNEIKKDILQTRKKDNQTNIYILPIVNISIVNPEEYIDAIAIGCMFTEISALKNRMIVYDTYASWINLSNDDFETKINKIKQKTVCKGSSSSILNAIQLLTKQKMDLSQLHIVIISDFSMESYDLDSKIKEMFYILSIKPPKIIYWNIGSKIPICHLTAENVCVSGSSSSTLKYVYQNIDNENMKDTYSLLNDIINQPRYFKIEEYFKKKIMKE
jgi:hypothetical protein